MVLSFTFGLKFLIVLELSTNQYTKYIHFLLTLEEKVVEDSLVINI